MYIPKRYKGLSRAAAIEFEIRYCFAILTSQLEDEIEIALEMKKLRPELDYES